MKKSFWQESNHKNKRKYKRTKIINKKGCLEKILYLFRIFLVYEFIALK